MSTGRLSGQSTRDSVADVIVGRIELVLAGALALLVVVLDVTTSQPWEPAALDLCACAAAAATMRWPRVAGTLLGAILVLYVFIPGPWATLGEYALMIPILGSGMRNRRRERAVMSAAYFVILAAIAWVDAPAGRSAVLGWLVWATLIGVLWLIGNVFVALVTAQRKARAAELVLQRQTLARQLHDTVARSLTQITMAAERARLRGVASDSDLELIAETARAGTGELRLLLTLLREPADLLREPSAHGAPIEAALAEARDALMRLGFEVSVVVQGSLERIGPEPSGAITDAIGEGTANILKHAEPDTACGIILDVRQSQAELVFVNRRRSESADGQSDSMGLDLLARRLARLGGELVVDPQPEQWTTRILLPVSTASAHVATGAS